MNATRERFEERLEHSILVVVRSYMAYGYDIRGNSQLNVLRLENGLENTQLSGLR